MDTLHWSVLSKNGHIVFFQPLCRILTQFVFGLQDYDLPNLFQSLAILEGRSILSCLKMLKLFNVDTILDSTLENPERAWLQAQTWEWTLCDKLGSLAQIKALNGTPKLFWIFLLCYLFESDQIMLSYLWWKTQCSPHLEEK